MKNIKFLFLMFFAAAIVTASCKKDDDGGEDGLDCTTVTFAGDIAPIVEASCATVGCHAAGSIVGDYTTYAGLEDRATNGDMEAAVLGSPPTMPKSGTLSQDELDKFKCWFDAGAPNN